MLPRMESWEGFLVEVASELSLPRWKDFAVWAEGGRNASPGGEHRRHNGLRDCKSSGELGLQVS